MRFCRADRTRGSRPIRTTQTVTFRISGILKGVLPPNWKKAWSSGEPTPAWSNDTFGQGVKYIQKSPVTSAFECSLSNHQRDYDTVHRRFHCGPRRLGELQHASLNFPSFSWGSADKHTCDHCIAGGMRRRSFPSRVAQKFSYFGERLCSDLCGPFPRSHEGFRYILCVVDASTFPCT